MKHLPALLFVGAVVIKVMSFAAWEQLAFPGFRVLLAYDPIGWWAAENLTPLFFDPRRFAPPRAEIMFFQFILVMMFALQWFAAAVLIRLVVRLIQRRREVNASSNAVTRG